MKTLRDIPFEYSRIDLPRITQYRPLNPSFVIEAGTIKVIYRGCNYDLRKSGYKYFYGSSVSRVSDTQNYCADLALNLQVRGVDFLEDRHIRSRTEALDGIQDLKVFGWQGRTFAVGSGCNSVSFLRKLEPSRSFSMMLFEIKGRHLDWLTTFPSPSRQEKNWMPWVMNGELYFIHRPNPFKLLKYEAQTRSVTECRSAHYDCLEEGTSGSGCIIPHSGAYLGMTHKKHGMREQATYSHRLIILDQDFCITQVSEPFTFEGERIEYGSGLAIHGGDIYIGYGVYDERATILRTDHAKLMTWLRWQACHPTTQP